MAGRHHSAGHLQRALQTEDHPSPPSGHTSEPPDCLQQLQRQETEAWAGRAEQKPSAVPGGPGLPAAVGGRWTTRNPTRGSQHSGKTLIQCRLVAVADVGSWIGQV